MTTSTKAPSKGSGTYLALQYLQRAGGKSTTTDLMAQLTWTDAPGRFQRLILGPLERQRLVLCRGEVVTLTSRGDMLLTPAEGTTSTATATTARPLQARPLSAQYRPGPRVMRPGAFDYREIPSVHAGHQVAFRSSITLHLEDDAA